MNLQELMSWRARTGILEQQKLANEQAMQKAVSQLDLRSPRTVYGYRPLEKKVPWFGEGGTIPTALGEIGSDAKSLFIDPMMPMIEGMKPKSPEENEKFLRGNYPELGRDIQSRIAKTGVGTRIGEQLVRRPAGYWQDKPNQGRGLNAVREDALMGVLGLSEFTPIGGTFAGVKALTANKKLMNKAISMLNKGIDRAKVWKDTGWFKDIDGKMKFEIDDSGASMVKAKKGGHMYPDVIGRGGRDQYSERPLWRVIDHKKAYSGYPSLEDIKTSTPIREGLGSASYSPESSRLGFDYRKITEPERINLHAKENAKSNILHECKR